jgi:hypothetical protein
MPQFVTLVFTSTQLVPHAVCPGTPQTVPQTPIEQTWPAAHTVPHAPQLFPSP